MRRQTALGLSLIAVLSGCSFFSRDTGVTRHSAPLVSDLEDSAFVVDSAAVELRNLYWSPHVEIRTWTTDEADVGLRAVLRRDGTLVRDHRVYVSTYASVKANSRFTLALTPQRSLKVTGISRDDKNCAGGGKCLPFETFGARIPDKLLRANRDSLPVRFLARNGNELIVMLHRDLITVYLASVDSVSSALRRR